MTQPPKPTQHPGYSYTYDQTAPGANEPVILKLQDPWTSEPVPLLVNGEQVGTGWVVQYGSNAPLYAVQSEGDFNFDEIPQALRDIMAQRRHLKLAPKPTHAIPLGPSPDDAEAFPLVRVRVKPSKVPTLVGLPVPQDGGVS